MKKDNHITNLKCFEQVASVIGREKAIEELEKARKQIGDPEKDLGYCMAWDDTPQRHRFWSYIFDGINPYD